MTRLSRSIGLFVLFALFAQLLLGQESKAKFVESDQPIFEIKKGQQYRFGYLEVPENRRELASKIIRLPVYIFKSRNPNPPKDPIIYTVGGPGYTSMRAAQYMNYYQYLDDRDFILFEQRGTQYAEPHLDCPEWANAVYQSNLPLNAGNDHQKVFEEAARDCRQRLIEKNIDLDHYNSNAIAADITDLVNALGIETYNLLTLSYSTKIAQVLMRDYPDKIRSVVMDSPLPLEVNYGEESLSNLMNALDKLLSDCEDNMACKEAYPQLKESWVNFLEEKTKTPLSFQVENPKTKEIENVMVKGVDLMSVFTDASTSSIAQVPYEMRRILDGDYSLIEEQIKGIYDGPGRGSGMGMRLSVWCSEEQSFNDESSVSSEYKTHQSALDISPEVFTKKVCDIWNVKSANVRENMPVKSDIPVLFISGEYDNETPPEWTIQMLDNFKNGHHLIFKAWKHGPTTNWSNTCAMTAANDFFNDPSDIPQTLCFKSLGRPDFKLK